MRAALLHFPARACAWGISASQLGAVSGGPFAVNALRSSGATPSAAPLAHRIPHPRPVRRYLKPCEPPSPAASWVELPADSRYQPHIQRLLRVARPLRRLVED